MARIKNFTRTLTVSEVTYKEVINTDNGVILGEEQKTTVIGEIDRKEAMQHLLEKHEYERVFAIVNLEVKEQKYSVPVDKFLEIAEIVTPKEKEVEEPTPAPAE